VKDVHESDHLTDGLRPSSRSREWPGFDTTGLRMRNAGNGAAADSPPASASARGYLLSRLPSIYQDDDFGLRFVGAVETVLDPIVALLDCLRAHFDPDVAPRDTLGLMAAWLGVALDETWPEERLRELVRRAAELGRLRGTRAGLELELRIAFPEVPLRVEDHGGVTYGTTPDTMPTIDKRGFVVYCDVPLSDYDAAALARAIERLTPVGTPCRLRIKAPRRPEPRS
jgi:phage tail-like protein